MSPCRGTRGRTVMTSSDYSGVCAWMKRVGSGVAVIGPARGILHGKMSVARGVCSRHENEGGAIGARNWEGVGVFVRGGCQLAAASVGG